MKKVPIFFIYAENCKECDSAKNATLQAIDKCKEVQSELKLFNSETDIALKIAINNNIEGIPACVVGPGGKVLQTSAITVDNVYQALISY